MKIKDLKIKDLRYRGPEYCRYANRLLIRYYREDHNDDTLDLFQEALIDWPVDFLWDDEELHQSLTRLSELHGQLSDDPPIQIKKALERLIKLNDECLIKQYCSIIPIARQLTAIEDQDLMNGDKQMIKGGAILEIGVKELEVDNTKSRKKTTDEGGEEDTLDDEEYLFPDGSTDDEEIISDGAMHASENGGECYVSQCDDDNCMEDDGESEYIDENGCDDENDEGLYGYDDYMGGERDTADGEYDNGDEMEI